MIWIRRRLIAIALTEEMFGDLGAGHAPHRFHEGKPYTRPILTTVDTRGLGDGFKGDVRIVGAKVRIVGRSRRGAESMVIDGSIYQK